MCAAALRGVVLSPLSRAGLKALRHHTLVPFWWQLVAVAVCAIHPASLDARFQTRHRESVFDSALRCAGCVLPSRRCGVEQAGQASDVEWNHQGLSFKRPPAQCGVMRPIRQVGEPT